MRCVLTGTGGGGPGTIIVVVQPTRWIAAQNVGKTSLGWISDLLKQVTIGIIPPQTHDDAIECSGWDHIPSKYFFE